MDIKYFHSSIPPGTGPDLHCLAYSLLLSMPCFKND